MASKQKLFFQLHAPSRHGLGLGWIRTQRWSWLPAVDHSCLACSKPHNKVPVLPPAQLPMSCRMQTRPSEGLDQDTALEQEPDHGNFTSRRLLQRQGVPLMFLADQLWELGFRGQGVRMGVFDTGIRSDHPHVKNIRCALQLSAPECAAGITPTRRTYSAMWAWPYLAAS